jgi:hypothetical protein
MLCDFYVTMDNMSSTPKNIKALVARMVVNKSNIHYKLTIDEIDRAHQLRLAKFEARIDKIHVDGKHSCEAVANKSFGVRSASKAGGKYFKKKQKGVHDRAGDITPRWDAPISNGLSSIRLASLRRKSK